VRFRQWRGTPPSWRAAAAVGAVAGLAACLKPHFAIIALAPELYWLIARRRIGPLIGPETVAAAAAAGAYAAHFLFVPTMRTAFFDDVVPLVARGYHVYDAGFHAIFVQQRLLWLPAAASPLLLLVRPRPREVAWSLAPPLVFMTVTSGLMYLVQGKGWMYHAIPAVTGAAVLLALLAVHFADGVIADRDVPWPFQWVAVAVALVLLASIAAIPWTTSRQLAELTRDPLANVIAANTMAGDRVLVVGTGVSPAYPLLTQLQRTPGSRFLFFFPIPMLYDGVSAAGDAPFPYRGAADVPMPAAEAEVWSDVRADVRSRSPKLVIIDRRERCPGCPPGFNIAAYLERTSFTATALASYHRAGNVDGFDVYLPNAR